MKKVKLIFVVLSLLASQAFAAKTVSVSGADALQLVQILEAGGAVKEAHLDEFSVEVRDVRVNDNSRYGIGPFHAPIYNSSLKLDAEQNRDLFNLLIKYVTSVGTPGNMTLSADLIECHAGPDVISNCQIITDYPVIRL